MDGLDDTPSDDDGNATSTLPEIGIDPTDDLLKVIRHLCARRDALRVAIDPDEVLQEIVQYHPQSLLRRGQALALKACRRLITGHLRTMSALDPDEDGPQFSLPGLERIPSHTMYPVAVPGTKQIKVVAKHTRDATLAQHEMCLALKQTNTQRCVGRERDQERIIDALRSTGCDTLREWEWRFGQSAGDAA